MTTPVKSPYAPPAVGDLYTYTVTYSGAVTEIHADGSLTIGEHTVPRTTGNGVVACMIGEPDDESCMRCSDSTETFVRAEMEGDRADRTETLLDALLDTIRAHHRDQHDEPLATCQDALCRRVDDMTRSRR
jgi:hypothetical protein